MNLYELTLAAESAISTYRNPDIEAWTAAIDDVLAASGQATIGRDKVEDISVSSEIVTIDTSYTVRSCDCSNTVTLPLSVLKAENPVREANVWRLRNELAETRQRIGQAQSELDQQTARFSGLQDELKALGVPEAV